MITGVIDQQVEEHFTVVDTNGNPVAGINTSEFATYVYNPTGSEVSGSISESIVELGDGNYKYLFTPNTTGTWYVVLIHSTYFPWGKTDDVQVYQGDISDIYENIIKTLGLTHHNFYIDQTVYDEYGNMTSARVRIYSDAASVGTANNIIETYMITADGTECGQFNYWAQVKM